MSPAALVFGTAVNLDRSIIDVVSQGEGEHPDIVQIQEILVQAARLNQDQTFNPGPSTSDVFAIGDQVLVTYPTRPDSKLTPKLMGPYTITSRSNDIYEVINPATRRTQTYHATRLRRFVSNGLLTDIELVAMDEDSYLVQEILAHRGGPNKTSFEFLIRWDGYGAEDDQWLPYLEVRDLEALDYYLECHPLF
ncbi:Chromo (CHRromatin Organization MOdifier) domain [Carpediemonas membranifera]|uniref:Chromo (CHRromatin Organization MOdifier) domain n=1 Tax=Carpediemonas membranifera TaxID=201153 RepID=A0A8J6E3Q7_9EUKA|nr:Chromo (CHRromatin Organization MOdifier) domain [Carpediemonas membranifera]|eukprot:KAG9393502.1 Chromo (CHRromatin Organization MOdifier) domain [Carpediemonas membranifera]